MNHCWRADEFLLRKIYVQTSCTCACLWHVCLLCVPKSAESKVVKWWRNICHLFQWMNQLDLSLRGHVCASRFHFLLSSSFKQNYHFSLSKLITRCTCMSTDAHTATVKSSLLHIYWKYHRLYKEKWTKWLWCHPEVKCFWSIFLVATDAPDPNLIQKKSKWREQAGLELKHAHLTS